MDLRDTGLDASDSG